MQESKRLRFSQAKVVQKWLNQTLSRNFETWKHQVSHEKHKAQVCAKILKRWTHLALASCFFCWRSCVKREMDLEQFEAVLALCSRVHTSQTHKILCARVFEVWESLVEYQVALRLRVADKLKAVDDYHVHLAWNTFKMLKSRVQVSRKASYHAAQLVRKALEKLLRLKVFKSWKDFMSRPLEWLNQDLSDTHPISLGNFEEVSSSSDDDSDGEQEHTGVLVKKATRKAQRSAPPPQSTWASPGYESRLVPPSALAKPHTHTYTSSPSLETAPFENWNNEDCLLSMGLTAHDIVRESKCDLFLALHESRRMCKLLEWDLQKVQGTGKALVTWCSVGINLSTQWPHCVTGEVCVQDCKGTMQHQPGYLNPIIYQGDQLMSIDGWDCENITLDKIKIALRGQVHTVTRLTFLRKPALGIAGRRSMYDVEVLRLSLTSQPHTSDTYFKLFDTPVAKIKRCSYCCLHV